MEKVIVNVDGMRCSMCEAHVNNLFRKALSLKKVSSSARKKQTIIVGEGPYDKASIEAALEGSGYKVLDVKIEPGE